MKYAFALIMSFVLTACANPLLIFSPNNTLFADAVTQCRVEPAHARVLDDGMTIIIDSISGSNNDGLDFNELDCMWYALHLPSYIKENMYATRAIDGLKKDSYKVNDESVDVTWSYDSDMGLNAVFHFAR